jgi:hypothetical protein
MQEAVKNITHVHTFTQRSSGPTDPEVKRQEIDAHNVNPEVQPW